MKPAYDKKRVRFLIIIGVIFIGLIIWLIVYGLSQQQENDPVTIKGLDSSVKNLSEESREEILAMLHNTIQLNVEEGYPVSTIKDITIREGSVVQEEIVAGRQYSGDFIVDIESIKQSYRIQFSYSLNEGTSFTGGYPVVVNCLPEEELIYGPFNCIDITSREFEGQDPVLSFTPYNSLNFEVRSIQNEEGVVSLFVTFLPTDTDYRLGINEAISRYKNEFLTWMRTNGLNPDSYLITYSH